ncbi:peptidase inhibitor family I36 protein [Streptomyces hoynatensis]|uniref:Beta/gamma crystallin 'Greek key' domain-containing protein n=1 Tax=Streptomyces hoynatensis TaxID=1141874 RepID=A0A3A9YWA1_9ACTN|nr:peptidase inhibitor family I36 protein [Streptomyces hoynatensis]RKN40361.1 hypothetical protein D7294_18045 [Streptomyces hoynatensis]
MKPTLGRSAVSLGVTAAALTTVLAAGTPANAAPAVTAASGITICVNVNHGNCSDIPGNDQWEKDPVKTYGDHKWQDSISSVYNHTTHHVCFYEHNNFEGRSITLPPEYAIDDLNYWNFNDIISSWKTCS